MSRRVYRMNGVEVDPSQLSVCREGQVFRLRSKTFQILIHFLEHPGQTITRDELLDRFWPGVSVTEDNLTHSVTEIRKALGDSPRSPRYMETIPKVGYRLAATVALVERQEAAPVPVRSRRAWLLAAALAVLLLAGVTGALWRAGRLLPGRGDSRKSVAVMTFENRSGNPALNWLPGSPLLAEAATNDLEAYRCYMLGLEAARAYRSEEAVQWFSRAVARDEGFAMAQARIGYTYVVSWGQPDRGKPYLEKAFRRAAALPPRDRLQIYAWFALANEDYPAAAKAYREILEAGPADLEARL
jgi:DNA-binding winged helix-turn-helix (wHTH) protein